MTSYSYKLAAIAARLSQIRYAVRLVWKAAPGWTVLHILTLLVQVALPLIGLVILKELIDSLVAAASGGEARDFTGAAFYAAAFGLLTLGGYLSTSLTTLAGEAQGLHVTDHVQQTIHEKSVAIRYPYYEEPDYFNTLHRAQQEALYRPAKVVTGLAQTATGLLTTIATVGLLLTVHWVISVILLASVIPGLVIRVRRASELHHERRRQTHLWRVTDYIHSLLVTAEFAKEIRMLHLGDYLREKYRSFAEELRQKRLFLLKSRSMSEMSAHLFIAAAVIGVLLFLINGTVTGAITIGGFVMSFQVFQRGMASFRDIYTGLAGLYEDTLFLEDLQAFLNLETTAPGPRIPVPRLPEKGIVFDHVSFRYPGTGTDALSDISIAIKPGEHIALVGANGSGKSTFIKLLCRLYEPTEGTITLDGVDIQQLDKDEYRRLISVLFQDFGRFYFTVRDNIWFGDLTTDRTDRKIEDAAQATRADTFIRRLPQGYESQLGRWFDEGNELSTGEWQKLGLSRGIMREAPIVIFDEPTSSLDPVAEENAFRLISRELKGKTVIYSSHRLSGVRLADRLYLLEGGRIVEYGTHEELMKMGRKYAAFFGPQAI